MKRIALALMAGMAVAACPVGAQTAWPAQPVKWIVPYRRAARPTCWPGWSATNSESV